MSFNKQLNDELPSPKRPESIQPTVPSINKPIGASADSYNIPTGLPQTPSRFHNTLSSISKSKKVSERKANNLTHIIVNSVESLTSSKYSNTPATIISNCAYLNGYISSNPSTSNTYYSLLSQSNSISNKPTDINTNVQMMLQTPTDYNNGVSQNNSSNNNRNNGKNYNNSNYNNGNNSGSGSGSGSGAGGFGGNSNNGNGNDGDDEKDNHKHTNDDKEEKDEEEEDDDEDEDEKEEEKKSSTQPVPFYQWSKQQSNLNGNAHEFTPRSRSASILSTIEEHHMIDRGSKSLPVKFTFGYSPIGFDRAQGCIEIKRMFTETIIPNMIRENIQNVYDFIDKATAIAMYHKTYYDYDNGKINIRVFNYGFHSKLDDQQVLYCVADKINVVEKKERNTTFVYVMRSMLFAVDDICSLCNLNMNDLPLSIYKKKPILNAMSYAKVMKRLFSEDIVVKTQWHKQYVFNYRKKNKKFNKQRHTFSITKNEFIEIMGNEMKKQNNIILIPIVMFNISSRGYRLEYINILHLNDNVSVGISYVCNNGFDVKVTGIHINKNNLINQHLLAVKCDNCHCFETFNSNIDELRIGNPDVDKNRCKDLKKKNKDLQNEKQKLELKINQLENENIQLKHTIRQYQQQSPYWRRNSIITTPSTLGSCSYSQSNGSTFSAYVNNNNNNNNSQQ